MRLLILGASGRLGSRLVTEALSQGHAVTAVARTPAPLVHPRLTWQALDIQDAAALHGVIPGHDAVVSALGFRRSPEEAEAVVTGIQHLNEGMRAHDVRRLVAVAAAGILQLDETRLRCERAGYPEAFRMGARAHRRVWELLEASGLAWTLVCPPELEEGERTQALRAQADRLPEGPLRASMEAVARWMIDALEGEEWVEKRVGIVDAPPA